jgi:hypothetical protein
MTPWQTVPPDPADQKTFGRMFLSNGFLIIGFLIAFKEPYSRQAIVDLLQSPRWQKEVKVVP